MEAPPITTVDDLVSRLRKVRYKTYNMKSDGVKLKTKQSRMLTPQQAVGEFNRCFELDIIHPGSKQNEEEIASCMLYDLANIPLAMIKHRKMCEIFDIDDY